MVVRRSLNAWIKEHFKGHITNFNRAFKILRLDEDRLVLKCKSTNIVICVDWINVGKQLNSWSIHALNKENIEKTNKKIEIFENIGFYSKDKKYCEVLLTYHNDREGEERTYNIGDVEIEVSEPSNLYKFLFSRFTLEKTMARDWRTLETIKVRGCNRGDLEGVLQKVLYLIDKYEASEFPLVGEYPQIVPFMFEHDFFYWNDPDEHKKFTQNDFKHIKYHEPMAFYNKARKVEEPIYYYRVLEFFFIINRKSEMKESIDRYNLSEDMDEFIRRITGLYGDKEKEQLNRLINNIEGKDDVVEQAQEFGLVKDNGIDNFANELYKYRNSFVHAKWDYRHDINVPNILQDSVKDEHWLTILRRLAEMVINQYCY